MFDIFPQKNPELSGSRDHGASGHPAGFHVQDPAVSDFYVEPKGGAALCRLTSVLSGAPYTRALENRGEGGFRQDDSLVRLFGLCARGLLRSRLSGARPSPDRHLPLPEGRSGAPTHYDLDGVGGAESPHELPDGLIGRHHQLD